MWYGNLYGRDAAHVAWLQRWLHFVVLFSRKSGLLMYEPQPWWSWGMCYLLFWYERTLATIWWSWIVFVLGCGQLLAGLDQLRGSQGARVVGHVGTVDCLRGGHETPLPSDMEEPRLTAWRSWEHVSGFKGPSTTCVKVTGPYPWICRWLGCLRCDNGTSGGQMLSCSRIAKVCILFVVLQQ